MQEPNSQHILNFVAQMNLHSQSFTGIYQNIIPGTLLKENGIEEREIHNEVEERRVYQKGF